jgi:hypothetical protein
MPSPTPRTERATALVTYPPHEQVRQHRGVGLDTARQRNLRHTVEASRQLGPTANTNAAITSILDVDCQLRIPAAGR